MTTVLRTSGWQMRNKVINGAKGNDDEEFGTRANIAGNTATTALIRDRAM